MKDDTQMSSVILNESTEVVSEYCCDGENALEGNWNGWDWNGQEKRLEEFHAGGGMMWWASKTNSSKI